MIMVSHPWAAAGIRGTEVVSFTWLSGVVFDYSPGVVYAGEYAG